LTPGTNGRGPEEETLAQTNLPASALVSAADDVLATTFEDEVVLLNLADGVYYGLDGVGARIWTLIQRPASLSQISEALRQEYQVERAQCEADLRALIAELEARGLVVVARA